MRVPRVYIAGKMTDSVAGYLDNCHRMIVWADHVRREGCSVYIPALDMLMGLVTGGLTHDDYFDNSQPWLDCADAIYLVPGWETSEGTKRELERNAQAEHPVPVFLGPGDLRRWVRAWNDAQGGQTTQERRP